MKTRFLAYGAVLASCAVAANLDVTTCVGSDTATGPILWQLLLEKAPGDGQKPRVFAVEGANQTAHVERAGADVKRYVYESVKKGAHMFNVKAVNCSEEPQPFTLALAGTKVSRASKTWFTGPDAHASNSPLVREALKESSGDAKVVGGAVVETLPPLSLTVLHSVAFGRRPQSPPKERIEP